MNKERTLALHGGNKTINKNFRRYNSIGEEERLAVNEVMRSGILSKYLGCWHEDFYGGPKVQEFERQWEKYFNVKHAITVNSWTSGLIAAVGALEIEPGDEIITTPWTMCATATSILHWNAIPVFADIERQTFNIDPQSIEENITEYTKAILAVDIFGHSADMDKIMSIAKRYNLKVISDTAQSPGAMYRERFAGTIADIGGYSLNYHKHIHTGEGGVLVTNDDELADRMRLIRNHAEGVVKDKGIKNLRNMLGYNFRLGEIECAIGIEQLKKLKGQVEQKQNLAERLSEGIKDLKGLEIPIVRPQCTHSYYIFGITLNIEEIGVNRDKIVEALRAEGLKVSSQYANLHLLPLYQEKIAYGSKGFPWVDNICKRNVNYKKGICQIAEKLNDESYIGIEMCVYDLDSSDIDLIIGAFRKVWNNLNTLA